MLFLDGLWLDNAFLRGCEEGNDGFVAISRQSFVL